MTSPRAEKFLDVGKSHGAVATCRICADPGAEFCPDFVVCNFRARIRLGVPRHVANQWRARDRWHYPRENGGKR